MANITNKVGKDFLAMLIKLGNASVGQVTVWHMPFSEILFRIEAGDISGAAKIFVAIFGRENGSGDYIPATKIQSSDKDIEYANIWGEDMAVVASAQIAQMAYTAENIKAVCEDMIAFGRAFQERTIDAVKNFFNVNIPYVKEVRRVGLLSRDDEPEISMAWTQADVEKLQKAFALKAKKMKHFQHFYKKSQSEGGFFRSQTEHVDHKRVVDAGKNARIKVFIADTWHKLSLNCVRLSEKYAEKAMGYTPSLSQKMMGKAEELVKSDANFAAMCYIALFFKENLFRSLSSLQAKELANARELFKREQLREQERAIKSRFRTAFGEIGNCLRQYAKELGFGPKKLALAAVWASFHSRNERGELVLVNDRVASKFADSVLEKEFAGLMHGSMVRVGEKCATEAMTPLVVCLLEDGDRIEFVENEAWSQDGETLLASVAGEEAIPDGEYTIRWNCEPGEAKRPYAAKPITGEVFSEEADEKRLAFMLSFKEGQYDYSRLSDAISGGKEVTLIPFKKGIGKNLVVVDGQAMATYRIFNFAHSKMIPVSEDPEQEAKLKLHRKNVQNVLNSVENKMGAKTGTVAGSFTGLVGGGKSVVILLDNVKAADPTKIQVAIKEKEIQPTQGGFKLDLKVKNETPTVKLNLSKLT